MKKTPPLEKERTRKKKNQKKVVFGAKVIEAYL